MSAQSMVALARANETRLARAALKRDLRERRLSLADVLEDECAQNMSVFRLLCAQYRYGPSRVRCRLALVARILGSPLPISESRTIGHLSVREKRALIQVFDVKGAAA